MCGLINPGSSSCPLGPDIERLKDNSHHEDSSRDCYSSELHLSSSRYHKHSGSKDSDNGSGIPPQTPAAGRAGAGRTPGREPTHPSATAKTTETTTGQTGGTAGKTTYIFYKGFLFCHTSKGLISS